MSRRARKPCDFLYGSSWALPAPSLWCPPSAPGLSRCRSAADSAASLAARSARVSSLSVSGFLVQSVVQAESAGCVSLDAMRGSRQGRTVRDREAEGSNPFAPIFSKHFAERKLSVPAQRRAVRPKTRSIAEVFRRRVRP